MTLRSQATTEFPLSVIVDGSHIICRSCNDELWIGVVLNDSCVGKIYTGIATVAVGIDELYQAP
jgi:hypothetical protein